MIDVESAMEDYANAGYNCIEIPCFSGCDPLLIAYSPRALAQDAGMDVLLGMPDILSGAANGTRWNDETAQVSCYELYLQGQRALYVDIETMGDSGWECVLQICTTADERDDGSLVFGYADMFDAAYAELEDNGLL